MKYVMIVLNAASDHPVEELEGKTPLEVGKLANLGFLPSRGRWVK